MRKVLLATNRKKEKDVLSKWLGRCWDVQSISNPREILSEAFDICLLDRKTYLQNRSFVKKRKEKDRDFAPCFIVVIPRKRIGEIGRDVNRLIDDLLYTPLEKTEFDLRLARRPRSKHVRPTVREREKPDERGAGKKRDIDRRLRILAVDDYSLNHDLLQLQLGDHDVTIVDRGAKALEKLGTRSFDIVLLDIQMPEMDGYQTAKKIRDPSSGVLNPEIPIIALSGHDKDSDQRLAADSGMDGFVKKPFKKETLVFEIERILARKNDLPPVAVDFSGDYPDVDRENDLSGVSSGERRRTPGDARGRKSRLMDLKATFELMGGKENIVKKVCDVLIADLPGKIESLRQSVASGSFSETRRISHDLKSGARCVCAEKAADLSNELERLSMTEDKERISETLPLVENAFKVLYRELRDYRNA